MKEKISVNKTKLYRLVQHYFEGGELPTMGKTEYRSGYDTYWLNFYSSDDIFYKVSFSRRGEDYMLSVEEINPFKAEAGEKLFSKVYHPSPEIIKNLGICNK